MGKVPAIRHEGRVVTETAAICVYLAEVFPEAGLAPMAEERAAYYRWMFFAAGPLEYAIAFKSLGAEVPEERTAMIGFGTYENAVGAVDVLLGRNDYVCGTRFTMVDVYVGSHIKWGLEYGTLPKRLAFEAYVARIAAREAHRRARRIDRTLIAAEANREAGTDGA